ncbi:GAF and ANTAR domain-containing protein [Dactylosporangium matsuzakiense]|uniref:Transcriptional regulator n=1 Tax=Dactylosporangium matsuzakiense TaxID=53360 RepID=A0A9W6KUE8_9ACTN|nr:GAF and ANTAR domain-containing protein [Dactylosporangium matsuzakiense]UWZ43857.1 GAF and ANTAR domain-containing protein [Dactylosporangium matsuzakiense]GLL07473.1 transcriptional regulator [Dactylosporangium matsuzakiense]
MTDLHTVEFAAVLRQLTARLIASDNLDEALEDLVETAADLVEGASWCTVTLVRAGDPSTAAASAGLPDSLVDTGAGPCMEAIRARDLILADDLSVDDRWPSWRPGALAAGVKGVLAVPVDIDSHAIGALTVYAAEPGRFTTDVGLTAMLVAEHAGLLLSAVLDRGRRANVHAELTTALTEALTDGETVNRAVGIMMVQRACSADAALEVLRGTAARLGLPLTAVAERLVETIEQRVAS